MFLSEREKVCVWRDGRFREKADGFLCSGMDMIMLSLFNARERERSDWEQLFNQADERFKDVRIWVPEGATLAVIDAVWAE